MKALNTMVFVSNMVENLVKTENGIKDAGTYENAKSRSNYMLGYIDALITFNNTMLCLENNDFTGDFDDVIYNWKKRVYQALADKAIETKQEKEIIQSILQKRDEL